MEKEVNPLSTNTKMSSNDVDQMQLQNRCPEIQFTLNDHELPEDNQSQIKNGNIIIDQTPTPIRFLKHCEDVSLFQEISLNPFDFEFRKASQCKSQISVNENNGVNESLETPRILPLVDSDETITSTSKDDNASNFSTNCSSIISDDMSIIDVDGAPKKCEEKKRLKLKVTSVACESSQSPSVISTPTPVITAGPSVSQALGSTLCSALTPSILSDSNSPTISLASCTDSSLQSLSPSIQFSSVLNHIPSISSPPYCTESPTTQTNTVVTQSSNASVPSSPATVLQLVLRLPNGQAIPVEIPATPVVSTSSLSSGGGVVSIAPAPISTQVYTGSSNANNGSSLAKMRLKQALASSSTAARPGATKHSRANTADRIAQMTRNRSTSGGSLIGDYQDDSNSASASPTNCNKRARRNSSPDEDPTEKRKKFLERNRVAAVRCREKKKQVVRTLYSKSEELERANRKLQDEVAVLKSLLLQHKDCPVTKAMKGDINVLGENAKYLPKVETHDVVADIFKSYESPVVGSGQVTDLAQDGSIIAVNDQGRIPIYNILQKIQTVGAPRARAMSVPIMLTNQEDHTSPQNGS